ncbi:MAG: rplU [Gammaproteobacteria bacterium]|jgi:large subunit ribosomal protein L21|nr:rplU [Gammaproteobacteria bacterium]
MYAVIATGGKQYKVSEGQVLHIEKLNNEIGATVDFDAVLLIGDGDKLTIGKPYIKGSTVSAEVLEQGRGEKIHIIKMRRRKHSRKKIGHRQSYTAVKITSIKSA